MKLNVTHLGEVEAYLVKEIQRALQRRNRWAKSIRLVAGRTLDGRPVYRSQLQEENRRLLRGLVAGLRVIRLAMGAIPPPAPASSIQAGQVRRALRLLVAANQGEVVNSWEGRKWEGLETKGPPGVWFTLSCPLPNLED